MNSGVKLIYEAIYLISIQHIFYWLFPSVSVKTEGGVLQKMEIQVDLSLKRQERELGHLVAGSC
jgi:hypothetical protein